MTEPARSSATEEVPGALRISGFGDSERVIVCRPGAINVVLARSGGGKTSLCRLVAGLDPPTAARVELGGRDLTGVDTRARNVGLVFGEFVNYPSLSVFDNIAVPLRARGVRGAALREQVVGIAQRLAIEALLDRLPEALSGGQQQRVALARALVRTPDALLLDEPLVNLDYKLRERLERELGALFRASRTVVLYTTSDPREALALADHLVLLDRGSVLAQGAPLALLRDPGSIAAADLLCDPGINLVDCVVREQRVELLPGVSVPLPAAASGPLRAAIRPDHLHPAAAARRDDLRLGAEVLVAETTGSDTLLHLRVGGEPWVAHFDGIHRPGVGERIELAVHPEDVMLFPAGAGDR